MNRYVTLALAAAFAVLGCTPPAEQVERSPIRFELPRTDFPNFLDVPFPNDVLVRQVDGERLLDLRAFPNPFNADVLDEYLALFQTVSGWSNNGVMLFSVDAGLDTTSLPQTAQDSMAPEAALFLVETAHPDKRLPIRWEYTEEGTSFLPPHTLSVLPLLGVALQGEVALVVTSAAMDANKVPLGPTADMQALMTCSDIDNSAALVNPAPDCKPFERLLVALQSTPEEIALMQIYTVQDSTTELVDASAWVEENVSPQISQLHLITNSDYSLYDVYEGTLDMEIYQAGEPPYDSFDGETGRIHFDDQGAPVVQRIEEVQFALTVPKGPTPSSGWPVVVYGHGTGGDLYSGVGEGPRNEAHQLARAGWAMMATSESFHAGRAGYRAGSEELLTFNLLNPVAGRDNWRQSALEKVQMVSAISNISLTADVTGNDAIDFDDARIAYLGHSQGGIVGALVAGIEDRVLGLFLSGAGAGFRATLVEKVEPSSLADVFRLVLKMPPDEPLNLFHPVPSLLQLWVDAADPLSFGRAWRHREVRRTPHLVMTSGLLDQDTPKRTQGALAAAFGLPLVEPVAEPVDVIDLLEDVAVVSANAQGNLTADNGDALTGGMLQYPDDGHFAIYYNPDAQEAYRRFFETLLQGAPIASVQ